MARALAVLIALRRLLSYRSSTMNERSRLSEISGQAILRIAARGGAYAAPDGPPPDWLALAIDTVLNDLGVRDFTPTYRDESEPPNFGVVGFDEPDGTHFGFGVSRSDSRADLLVSLADGIQEHLPEARTHWGEALPPCPEHPHPMRPIVADATAWWSCPYSGRLVARIGELHGLARQR